MPLHHQLEVKGLTVTSVNTLQTEKIIGTIIVIHTLESDLSVVLVKETLPLKRTGQYISDRSILNNIWALCSVDKCNFSCNDFGVLKVHQYDEHGIGKEARCLKCQKKFNNYRVFERHIKLCQLPKDKECPFCKKSYKSTERLIGHMATVHRGKPRLMCEQCGKVLISKDSLRVHKSNTHKYMVNACAALACYTKNHNGQLLVQHASVTCGLGIVAHKCVAYLSNTYLYIRSLIGNDVLQHSHLC